MDQSGDKNKFLTDVSGVLAALLPILQLAFVYLPDGLKTIYLQRNQFLGVSILTLVVSYVSLLAYRTRPWAVMTSPFSGKKLDAYNAWQLKKYEAGQVLNQITGKKLAESAVNKYLKFIDKDVKRPFQINSENRVASLIILLFINSILFLMLGLANTSGWLAILQSINYFFIIVISVLLLVIYRDTVANAKRYDEEKKQNSARAIDLAIRNNCFTPQPQVKFISAYGGDGINNHYVRVQFQDDDYEICTNSSSSVLVYCHKLSST
jgi:hypothetical protein